MAVDPNKLSALVEAQAKNPMMPELPPADEEVEDTEEEGEAKTGEEVLEELGEFGATLRESADILVSTADEIGDGLISEGEIDPAVEEEVESAVDRMPDMVVEGLGALEGIDHGDLLNACNVLTEDAAALGAEVTEGAGERLCGLLEAAVQFAGSSDEEEEEETEEEEVEEEEEIEEEAPI